MSYITRDSFVEKCQRDIDNQSNIIADISETKSILKEVSSFIDFHQKDKSDKILSSDDKKSFTYISTVHYSIKPNVFGKCTTDDELLAIYIFVKPILESRLEKLQNQLLGASLAMTRHIEQKNMPDSSADEVIL